VFLYAVEPDAHQIPLPQPPFVTAPPKGTSWELLAQRTTTSATAESSKGAREATPNANRLEAIHYQFGSQITYISFIFTNGLRIDHYIKGNMDYTLYLPTKQTSAKIYSQPGDADPFICKGFPGVEWLSSASYVGLEGIGKVMCYHFHLDAIIPGPSQSIDSKMPELDAWIDSESKLPVRIKIDAAVFAFSPLKPAGLDIEIPAELKASMQGAEKELHALELMIQANSRGER
jgi:hypothetical protein